jgi:hypothetical protein
LMPQPTAQRVWGEHQQRMEAQMQEQMQAEQMEIARAAREQAFAEMAGFGPMRQGLPGACIRGATADGSPHQPRRWLA